MAKENTATTLFNLIYDLKKNVKDLFQNDNDCGMIAVLKFLYEKGQGFANQISQELSLSRARLFSIIKKLQKKEFINVELDVLDKRKMILNLTENGFNYIVNLKEKRIDTYCSFLEKIGDENADKIIQSLSEINDILKENE
ncbi:MAG: MarR family winged helix-turn-helix transcriptional regulator [Bacilli bacterium]